MATVFYEHDANPNALRARPSRLSATAARDMPRRRTCATADTRSSSVWTRIVRSAQQAKADGFGALPRRGCQAR